MMTNVIARHDLIDNVLEGEDMVCVYARATVNFMVELGHIIVEGGTIYLTPAGIAWYNG